MEPRPPQGLAADAIPSRSTRPAVRPMRALAAGDQAADAGVEQGVIGEVGGGVVGEVGGGVVAVVVRQGVRVVPLVVLGGVDVGEIRLVVGAVIILDGVDVDGRGGGEVVLGVRVGGGHPQEDGHQCQEKTREKLRPLTHVRALPPCVDCCPEPR